MTSQNNAFPPRVVIVGRPNVGKSTLYNRLYGSQRAITHSSPGVTRDALEEDCLLDGLPIRLVDTGGIKVNRDEVFDSIVAKRSLEMIRNADLVLFIVERGGLTGEDQTIAEELRQEKEEILLLVNKIDSPEKDHEVHEYHALGWGTPLAISASHGRNIDLLKERIKQGLKSHKGKEIRELPVPTIRLALIGRPNAGKSTLANHLTNSESSLVSSVPGTTRDIVRSNFTYKGQHLRVLDTAGIRRRRSVRENVEYYSVNRAIRAMAEADVTVLLLEVGRGISDQDKKIAAQAVKRDCALVMALNKGDLLKGDKKLLVDLEEKIRFRFPVLDWAPLVSLSAINGQGTKLLLDTILKVDRQQRFRVETAELNKALREWLALNPPPMHRGRVFKVKYLTQVSTHPVRFVVFVNRTQGFPDFYKRYLINQIRREFRFSSVPVNLELRENR